MPSGFGRIELDNGTLFFGDTGEQIATVISAETVEDSITTSELSELVEEFSDLQKALLSGIFAVNDFMDALVWGGECLETKSIHRPDFLR